MINLRLSKNGEERGVNMDKEIKSVLAMKPRTNSKTRVKETLKIVSTVVFIGCLTIVGLVSCGNTANMQDEPKIIKQTLVSNSTVKYTVQPGDTLTGIAAKHSDRWSADTPLALITESIKERNSKVLINGYLLQAGSVIEVPIWR